MQLIRKWNPRIEIEIQSNWIVSNFQSDSSAYQDSQFCAQSSATEMVRTYQRQHNGEGENERWVGSVGW